MTKDENKDAGKRADAFAVDQQHDAPDALYREHGASERMRMPHERDESASADSGGANGSEQSPEQSEVIGQARDDLARGLQDTDCRGQRSGLGKSDACPPSQDTEDERGQPVQRTRAGPSNSARERQ